MAADAGVTLTRQADRLAPAVRVLWRAQGGDLPRQENAPEPEGFHRARALTPPPARP